MPELADLAVAPFESAADGIAEGHQIRSFQEEDLRLQQPAAFEFNAAQRRREGIARTCLDRQQGRRPYYGVNGMSERGEMDCLSK